MHFMGYPVIIAKEGGGGEIRKGENSGGELRYSIPCIPFRVNPSPGNLCGEGDKKKEGLAPLLNAPLLAFHLRYGWGKKVAETHFEQVMVGFFLRCPREN